MCLLVGVGQLKTSASQEHEAEGHQRMAGTVTLAVPYLPLSVPGAYELESKLFRENEYCYYTCHSQYQCMHSS